MSLFGLNILLAVVWAALTASFTASSLLIGYILGYWALWLSKPLFKESNHYFGRTWRVLRLIGFFLYDLVVSSFRVAWDIVTPTHRSNPGIVEVPLDVKSDLELLLVTNLISLTPGTLSLDVSEDRKTLIVHAMFVDDPDALIAELKNGMERMVRECFE